MALGSTVLTCIFGGQYIPLAVVRADVNAALKPLIRKNVGLLKNVFHRKYLNSNKRGASKNYLLEIKKD